MVKKIENSTILVILNERSCVYKYRFNLAADEKPEKQVKFQFYTSKMKLC